MNGDFFQVMAEYDPLKNNSVLWYRRIESYLNQVSGPNIKLRGTSLPMGKRLLMSVSHDLALPETGLGTRQRNST
jgi:hypothetical protein